MRRFSLLALPPFLVFATACSGGLIAIQRNVEAQGHPVDHVHVRQADGKKVVTVYTEQKVGKDEAQEIERITRETMPDVTDVRVKKAEAESENRDDEPAKSKPKPID
jgi:hypothetical protein